MGNEVIQLQELNNDLLLYNPEERIRVIDKAIDDFTSQYPTMANRDKYMLAVKEGRINVNEDFAVYHVGETIDHDDEGYPITKVGGMSKDYVGRVNKLAELRHWKGFWLAYNELENNKDKDLVPDFNWHFEYVKYYCQTKKPKDSLIYLKALRYKMLVVEIDMPLEGINIFKEKLDEHIEVLEDLINTMEESNELQSENEELSS